MSGNYPNLGFDPAPGMPLTVEGLRSTLASTKAELDTAYQLVGGVGRTGGVWDSEAAEAFTRRMDELPRHLEKGRLSLGEASTALQYWHGQLTAFQRRAAAYEGKRRGYGATLAKHKRAMSAPSATPTSTWRASTSPRMRSCRRRRHG